MKLRSLKLSVQRSLEECVSMRKVDGWGKGGMRLGGVGERGGVDEERNCVKVQMIREDEV